MDPNIIVIVIASVILFVILNYLDHAIRNKKDKGLREKLTQFLKASDLTGSNWQDAEVLIRDLNSFFPWVRKVAINRLVENDSRGVETIFTALDLPYYMSWTKGSVVITQDEYEDIVLNLIYHIRPSLISGLTRIGHSSIEKLKDGLRHPNLNVRLSVIDALGKTGNSSAVEFLVPILDSSDIEERISAIVALGEIRAKSATEKIVDALKDENPIAREEAVRSLGKINDIRALPALEMARSDHTVIEIRGSQTIGSLAEKAIEEIRKSNSQ